MSSSEKKGKILFIPMCTQGHINYCVPLANRFIELYGDENEVHFALNQEYTDKLKKQVPLAKFTVYENPEEKKYTGHWLVEVMQQFAKTWSDDLVSYTHNCAPVLEMNFKGLKEMYPILNEIIDEIKPDFIIFDQLFSLPTGKDRGIPWANLFSAALNYVGYEKFPPPQSGLPTEYTPENVKLWQDFIDRALRVGPFKQLIDNVNNFMKEKGLKGLEDQNRYFVYEFSEYLNIYGYPQELDYQEEENRRLPGNWMRIESPIRSIPEPFPVPEKLENLPGKLIYFSLGSMAAVYQPLMQKMLDILEKLPHRFIISTGLIGDQYEMKHNMYGEKYLPQFSVLQTVDMVISHGGNNTLTEAFFFGKPLIFTPLFGDQPDNAQRMHEKGLGRRANIFGPTDKLKQEIEDGIEFCSRESVISRMKQASERIQKDTGMDKVCEEILRIIQKK